MAKKIAKKSSRGQKPRGRPEIVGINDEAFQRYFEGEGKYNERFFKKHVWWWHDYDKYLHNKFTDEMLYDLEDKGKTHVGMLDISFLEWLEYFYLQNYDIRCFIDFLFNVEILMRVVPGITWAPISYLPFTRISEVFEPSASLSITCQDLVLDIEDKTDEELTRFFKHYLRKKRQKHNMPSPKARKEPMQLRNGISAKFNVIEMMDRRLSMGKVLDSDKRVADYKWANARKAVIKSKPHNSHFPIMERRTGEERGILTLDLEPVEGESVLGKGVRLGYWNYSSSNPK